MRKAKSYYHKDLLRTHARSPDRFWKALKQVFNPNGSGAVSTKKFEIDGESTYSPTKIASGFNSFFATVAQSMLKKANSMFGENQNLSPLKQNQSLIFAISGKKRFRIN